MLDSKCETKQNKKDKHNPSTFTLLKKQVRKDFGFPFLIGPSGETPPSEEPSLCTL